MRVRESLLSEHDALQAQLQRSESNADRGSWNHGEIRKPRRRVGTAVSSLCPARLGIPSIRCDVGRISRTSWRSEDETMGTQSCRYMDRSHAGSNGTLDLALFTEYGSALRARARTIEFFDGAQRRFEVENSAGEVVCRDESTRSDASLPEKDREA